ncbi:MAG TPA: efflux RND transporter periplasmic adaptor subunit [Phycisphaerae bacterium]|nr:efflux RND transporter periplasmic adaptor subunit [Phycisphaerae bacterium]HNU46451.1 efflux RND transporter periplasmic adaptor subunit [Phycisphaerae bacterium]
MAQLPATKVVAEPAKMTDAPATVTVVGTLRAVRRSRVASEMGGMAVAVPVRQGDCVEAGAVLCHLHDDTLRCDLAAAQARLASLQARHEELLAGTRAEELTRIKAVFDEAVAEFERWDFEWRRIENLYKEGKSNPKELQDTESSFRRARQVKIAAEAAHQEALNGPRKETIAQAAHDVAAQQAQVQRLQQDLEKMVIRAPFAGCVTELATEVGQWVSAGGTIVELADLRTVLAVIGVPEYAYPFVTVGAAARVQVEAIQRSFEGRIKHVIPQANEEARTFPVEIEIENPERLLAGGLFVRATVPGGPAQQTVAVPKDSLVEQAGIFFVGTVMPGQQGDLMGILMPVSVGSDVGDWVAITSPNVQPGMMIVTRGNERLFPFPSPVVLVDSQGRPVELPPAGGGLPGGQPPAGAAGPQQPDQVPPAQPGTTPQQDTAPRQTAGKPQREQH